MKYGKAGICFIILIAGCFLAQAQTVRVINHRGLRPTNRFGSYKKSQVKKLPPLLQMVIDSVRTIRYRETRTVTALVGTKYISHVEFLLRSGPNTRITFPNNSQFAGQVIVDNGTNRERYMPKANVIQIRPSFQDEALSGLVNKMGKARNLNVEITNSNRIAGKDTEAAVIRTNAGRILQKLWINPETGAILKRVGYGIKGQIVASFEVSQIEFNPPIPEGSFAIRDADAKRVTQLDVLRRNARKSKVPLIILDNKSGYKLIASKPIQWFKIPILRAVYQGKEGQRVSVFELDHQLDEQAFAQKMNKRQKVAITKVGGVTVVMIGPLSEKKLQSLSSYLKRL